VDALALQCALGGISSHWTRFRLLYQEAQIELERAAIAAAEVRLFGSRARGEAGPDSDVVLLITAPDAWLASRDLRTWLRLWNRTRP